MNSAAANTPPYAANDRPDRGSVTAETSTAYTLDWLFSRRQAKLFAAGARIHHHRGQTMARGDVRIAVTLACEECKRRNYQTNKSKRNNPDRITLRKYCKWCRCHRSHKETR